MRALAGEGSFMSRQGHILGGDLKNQGNRSLTPTTGRGMSYKGAQILRVFYFELRRIE